MCVPLWNNKAVTGLIYVDTVRESAAYSRADLEVLTLVANLAAIKIENVRLFERDRQMKEMERELAAAARIQQRLLPAGAPPLPGYAATGRNEQCLAVGGDYYDFQLRGEGKMGLAVGDVSGKGMGAALLMAGVQAAFRAHLDAGAGLSELIARLNRVVLDNSTDAQFLTFFCGDLDAASGKLRWVNAGHNPPFLLRAGGEVEKLFTGGIVLGILPSPTYEVREAVLEPGDLLALYSDGITEARGPGDEEFGEERLIELLGRLRTEPVETIEEKTIEAVRSFAGSEPQHDDMTLVLVRRD
jgi:serine phosphatase RsbU (regulator of sigma subunit)